MLSAMSDENHNTSLPLTPVRRSARLKTAGNTPRKGQSMAGRSGENSSSHARPDAANPAVGKLRDWAATTYKGPATAIRRSILSDRLDNGPEHISGRPSSQRLASLRYPDDDLFESPTTLRGLGKGKSHAVEEEQFVGSEAPPVIARQSLNSHSSSPPLRPAAMPDSTHQHSLWGPQTQPIFPAESMRLSEEETYRQFQPEQAVAAKIPPAQSAAGERMAHLHETHRAADLLLTSSHRVKRRMPGYQRLLRRARELAVFCAMLLLRHLTTGAFYTMSVPVRIATKLTDFPRFLLKTLYFAVKSGSRAVLSHFSRKNRSQQLTTGLLIFLVASVVLYGRLVWVAFFGSQDSAALSDLPVAANVLPDLDLFDLESVLEPPAEAEPVAWQAHTQALIAKLHQGFVSQKPERESALAGHAVSPVVGDALAQLKHELSSLKLQLSAQEELLRSLADKLQVQEADKADAATASPQTAELSLESKIEQIVSHALSGAVETLSSDRIGRPDFALYSMGARPIAALSTEALRRLSDPISRLLGIGIVGRPHRAALQPDMSVGQCWSFAGSAGRLTIELAKPLHVSHVSVDHVSRAVVLDRSSAPRHFEVFGLGGPTAAAEPGVLLGSFEYILAEAPVQTFALQPTDQPYRYLSLRILSNWGHPEYTCLYRWRVHSAVAEQQAHPELFVQEQADAL